MELTVQNQHNKAVVELGFEPRLSDSRLALPQAPLLLSKRGFMAGPRLLHL